MTDLALTYDYVADMGDLCVLNGDLVLDDGLHSLALMSLLTEARALPADVDKGVADLRGYWGDAIEGRPLGGRMWTLARAKATPENIRRYRDFASEALRWLVDDGIAGDVDVQAMRADGVGSGATLHLEIRITRADGVRENLTYDFLWRAME